MTVAQTSLLKKIDELRRFNNLEAAETWQDVYTRLYGALPDQYTNRAGGFFPDDWCRPALKKKRTH